MLDSNLRIVIYINCRCYGLNQPLFIHIFIIILELNSEGLRGERVILYVRELHENIKS